MYQTALKLDTCSPYHISSFEVVATSCIDCLYLHSMRVTQCSPSDSVSTDTHGHVAREAPDSACAQHGPRHFWTSSRTLGAPPL